MTQGIIAIVVCGIAWLVTATSLTLDLLGRAPLRRRPTSRAFRLQALFGLAAMTALILSEVASLQGWARPIRLTFDVLLMLMAVGLVVVAITGLARRSAPAGGGRQ